jgi:hypothetical protein
MSGESVERLTDIVPSSENQSRARFCQQSDEIRDQLGNIFEEKRKFWNIDFRC